MSDAPVTVLMTAYNGGEYLEESVKSILDQTYCNFEFLIVNDCSTDNTLEILESFQDERIRIHNNERNVGQTKSLNLGLKIASGKYIARMDADDIAFPNWLEHQLKFIEENSECVVVSTKAAVIDSTNRTVKILNSATSFEDVILKSLIAAPINHVGSLFQKDIVLGHGGYDESFKIAQDYELWTRLLRKKHRIVSTDEILIAIRVHEQSISIVEREKTSRPEMSRIMTDNINWLTNMDIGDKDIQLFWQLIYSSGQLSNDQFTQANIILQNIYKNIRADLEVGMSLINTARRGVERTTYAKRIFALIENNNTERARLTALEYVRKRGALNLFGIIWVFSFFGIGFLRCFPVAYKEFSEKRARFRLIGIP